MALTDVVFSSANSASAERGNIGVITDALFPRMSNSLKLIVPLVTQVQSGVEYGQQGTELTGSYIGGSSPMLTSGAVDQLAAAIWAKPLPLGAAPTPTYGDTTLTVDELDVLAHAVWSKTLP